MQVKSAPLRFGSNPRRVKMSPTASAAMFDAEQTIDARAAHTHGIAPRQLAANVGERTRAAAAHLEHQLRRAVDGSRRVGEVHAALEAECRHR